MDDGPGAVARVEYNVRRRQTTIGVDYAVAVGNPSLFQLSHGKPVKGQVEL